MKKTNNKGFSLVELIIVIAIMVILVAVIAPQYLKFVNNSRVSTDIQTAAEIATAIDVTIADGTYSTSVKTSYESTATRLTDYKFVIDVDADNGVKTIYIQHKTDTSKKYQCYPNPEAADGVAGASGLKK